MHSKTLLSVSVLALATAVAAAPLPTSADLGSTISNILGSPFGNGNGDGNGNEAGDGNDGNASGNGSGDGNKNGNGNIFGNGDDVLSGNSGIGKRVATSSSSSDPIGTVISGVLGSPFGNGNGDGNGNSAGNGNDGNAAGNGVNDGNGNGDNNIFGNGDDILSGNSGIGRKQKVRQLPSDALDVIPDQTVEGLQTDVSQVVTDGPTDVGGVLNGVVSGDDTSDSFAEDSKRQVLTGVEDVIAQDLAGYIPKA